MSDLSDVSIETVHCRSSGYALRIVAGGDLMVEGVFKKGREDAVEGLFEALQLMVDEVVHT